ncbi:MAG: S-methyl-5'-thioadenosine phosphorylase [Candidatus Falkowbacteria bacterium]
MKNIKIAIIGGSGLDDPKILKNAEEKNIETPYGKTSSSLTCGKIQDVDVVILARHGRGHTIPPTQVPFRANLWALKKLGCTHIIATTACGSLKEEIKPRDFVFLDQFIDMTKHRNLTFYEDFEEKIVHTPMAEPFCPSLRKILIKTAKELSISHHETGAVITIEGPRFSTKAESNFFRQIGGSIINMSTVPEVILARELGICYATIAMSTDYDCWREGEESVTWDIITRIMKENSENAKKLLIEVISKINFENCDHCGANK